MLVRELIEILKTMPQGAEVVTDDGGVGLKVELMKSSRYNLENYLLHLEKDEGRPLTSEEVAQAEVDLAKMPFELNVYNQEDTKRKSLYDYKDIVLLYSDVGQVNEILR